MASWKDAPIVGDKSTADEAWKKAPLVESKGPAWKSAPVVEHKEAPAESGLAKALETPITPPTEGDLALAHEAVGMQGGGSSLEQALATRVIPELPKITAPPGTGTVGKLAEGFQHGMADLVNSLGAVRGLATLGVGAGVSAFGPQAARAIAGAFALYGASQAPGQVKQIADAPDASGKVERGINLAGTLFFSTLGGIAAAHPELVESIAGKNKPEEAAGKIHQLVQDHIKANELANSGSPATAEELIKQSHEQASSSPEDITISANQSAGGERNGSVQAAVPPLDAGAGDQQQGGASSGEAIRQPASASSLLTPAIKVGDEVVKGEPGDTHADIIRRAVSSNAPNAADVAVAAADDANHVFTGPQGDTLDRQQAGDFADANGLRKPEQVGKPLQSEHLNGVAGGLVEGSVGPGAAHSSEFPPQKTTALKRATVDVERLQRGSESIPTPERQRQADVVRSAEDKVDADPSHAPGLIARIVDGGDRAISEDDAAVLLVERARLGNERTKWEEVKGSEEASPAEKQHAQSQLDGIEPQADRLDKAQRSAGSSWSDVGRMYQQQIKEDFTLEALQRKARASKGGPLTPEEHDTIKSQADHIAELEKQLSETQKATREKGAIAAADETVKKLKVDATKATTEPGDTVGKITEAIKKRAADGDTPKDLQGFIQQLALHFVRSGVKEREPLIDAVHGVISKIFPDMEREHTRDAISGYGDYKQLDPEPAKAQLRQLKGEMQQIGKIEDMQAGQAPKKTGTERRTPSDQERALIKEVNELKKKGGFNITDPATQLKSALDAVKTRLKNRQRDLELAISSGNKIPTTKTGVPLDEEAKALRTQVDELQTKYNAMLEPEKAAARIASQQETIKKQIGEIQAKIAGTAPDAKGAKIARPAHPELEPLMQERDKLRNDLAEVRKQNGADEAMQKRLDALNSKINSKVSKLMAGDVSAQEKSLRMNRPLPNAELETAQQKLDSLNKLSSEIRRDANRADPTETALKAYKTRTQTRIDDLEDKVSRGAFDKPVRKPPITLDTAAEKMKLQLQTLKNQFTEGLLRKERENRPVWQKAVQGTAELAKGLAISGYHSLIKIMGFDVAKLVEEPIHQLVGTLTNKTTGAAQGSLESGAGIGKELSSYYSGFSRGVKEALGVYRTGKSPSDVLYGKPKPSDAQWYDWVGSRLHAALKHTVFSATEQKYRANGFANAEKMGQDISNEFVRAAINKAAFERANSAKLQENNAVADAVSGLHARMEKDNPLTGKPDITKTVVSSILKTFVTKGIIKTPANFISQIVQRTPAGLLAGVGKLAVGAVRGLDTLKPSEVDAIHSLLKAGSVGSAMFLWGVIDATKKKEDRVFGGYYEPGRKDGDGDAKWGTIRIGDYTAPHLATHNLLTEPAQMGSTMMRVAMSRFGKKSEDTKGMLEGAVASVVGLGAQAPVAGPIMRMAAPGQNLSGQIASGLVPQLLSNIAADTDKDERAPKSASDYVKMGIPGLRQTVPKKTMRKGRKSKW